MCFLLVLNTTLSSIFTIASLYPLILISLTVEYQLYNRWNFFKQIQYSKTLIAHNLKDVNWRNLFSLPLKRPASLFFRFMEPKIIILSTKCTLYCCAGKRSMIKTLRKNFSAIENNQLLITSEWWLISTVIKRSLGLYLMKEHHHNRVCWVNLKGTGIFAPEMIL